MHIWTGHASLRMSARRYEQGQVRGKASIKLTTAASVARRELESVGFTPTQRRAGRTGQTTDFLHTTTAHVFLYGTSAARLRQSQFQRRVLGLEAPTTLA